MQGQLMGNETNSSIQEHIVDLGQPLRNVCPNIQGGADLRVFFPARRMLKMKFFSADLLPMNIFSLMKL